MFIIWQIVVFKCVFLFETTGSFNLKLTANIKLERRTECIVQWFICCLSFEFPSLVQFQCMEG